MTLAELRNKILAIKTVVEDQSRAAPAEDAAIGLAILMGVDVLGEVACDLKRIADATERLAGDGK